MKKKTTQLLLLELFLSLKKKYQKGKEILVDNDFGIAMPARTILCPIMWDSMEMVMGFCIDHDSIPYFSLFGNTIAGLAKDKKLPLVELIGGKIDGIGPDAKYINKFGLKHKPRIPLTQVEEKNGEQILVEKNYPLVFGMVWQEIGLFLKTGEFHFKERIEDGRVKLPVLTKNNYHHLDAVLKAA